MCKQPISRNQLRKSSNKQIDEMSGLKYCRNLDIQKNATNLNKRGDYNQHKRGIRWFQVKLQHNI